MCYGEVVSSSIQKARREGKSCGSCGRRIVAGATYVMKVVRGYDDGLLNNWKLCKTCATIVHARWDAGEMSCPIDLREDFVEATGGRIDAMRARLRKARDRVFGKKEGE